MTWRDSDPDSRAVELVRRQIPWPPDRMDEVILAAVRRDCAVRGSERRGRTAARWCSAYAALHPRRAAGMAMAFALALATTLVSLPGRSPGPSLAAASPFISQCDEHGRGRLEVAGVWRGREGRNFRAVLARFERRTGTRVTYKYETHDIADTLKARLDRGCPPDIALLPQPGLLRDLARRGDLQPMGPTVRGLVQRNYAHEWRHRATVDGKLYGVWFKAANKSTFWYSRSAFRRAGVQPPQTWRGLMRVAAKLRAAGIAPFSVAGADGWTLTDLFENVYLATAGRARYDALAQQKLAWTDPTVTVALKRLAEILGRGDWLAGGTSGALRTDFGESTGQVFGRRPVAAMMFEGDFVASLIAEQPDAQKSDIGLFVFPRLHEHRQPTVVGGDVGVQFTRKGVGRELLKYLATPKAAEPWVRAGGFISPNLHMNPRAYPDATTRRLASAVVSGAALRFDLSDLQPPSFGASAGQGMWWILQRYLRNTTSMATTTKRLENAARGARLCERLVRGLC
jgi:alpha-glucoside transport system substrate-binding protein